MRILYSLVSKFCKPIPVFTCIFVLFILGFISHALFLGKTVYGDGILYFSWLHSSVVDKDLDFTNEYSHFKVKQPLSGNNTLTNKYTVGPALLWFPAYFCVHSLFKGTGYELPYQFVVGLSSVFFCITGLILLYRLLLQLIPQTAALLTILALAFASHLFFYGSIDTVNSHAFSFFASTLFISVLFQKNITWFTAGASLGLIGILRPQDILMGILVIPFLLKDKKTIGKHISLLVLGFLPFIAFQLVSWRLVFSQWILNSYAYSGEGFNFLQPHILSVLFNPINGLFLYTPLCLFSLYGLIVPWKQYSFLKPYIIYIFFLEVYLISSWSTPLQGASYSGRMFIGVLPLLSIALGVFMKFILQKWNTVFLLFSFVLPLSAINCILIIYTLLRLP